MKKNEKTESASGVMNVIDVESLFAALYRNGHAKLSDHIKKTIGVILMLFCLSMSANAQSFTIKGNEIVQVKKDKQQKADNTITTKMTYNHNGKTCQVKLSKNGRAFAEVESKNGNTYTKYFGEDISKQLCKQYGVTYTEKKTR